MYGSDILEILFIYFYNFIYCVHNYVYLELSVQETFLPRLGSVLVDKSLGFSEALWDIYWVSFGFDPTGKHKWCQILNHIKESSKGFRYFPVIVFTFWYLFLQTPT